MGKIKDSFLLFFKILGWFVFVVFNLLLAFVLVYGSYRFSWWLLILFAIQIYVICLLFVIFRQSKKYSGDAKEFREWSDEVYNQLTNKTNNQNIIQKEVQGEMAYEEINPGIWKPEKEGDEIESVLISISKDVGVNKSMLYTLDVQGKPTGVWGSTVLDSRMTLTKPGDLIKIVYVGLGESAGGKNAPKIFKVFIDKK